MKERDAHPQTYKPKDRALRGSASYDPLQAIGADYWEWKAERVKSGLPSILKELGGKRAVLTHSPRDHDND